MVSRQSGHFFFEPKGYDKVNHATHEHKEDIKVGYNLQRKAVLLAIWALSPAVLWFNPTLFGLFPGARRRAAEFISHVGDLWLTVGLRRAAVPHRAAVLHPRRADGPGVDHQDHHRPVPRCDAVLPRAAGAAAR